MSKLGTGYIYIYIYIYKLDEPDMQDTAGEAETSS